MPWVLRVILAVKFKQWSLYNSIIFININIGTQVEAGALALETRVTMALMVRPIVLEKANWYCPGCRWWQLGLVQVSELLRRSVLEYLWGTKKKRRRLCSGAWWWCDFRLSPCQVPACPVTSQSTPQELIQKVVPIHHPAWSSAEHTMWLRRTLSLSWQGSDTPGYSMAVQFFWASIPTRHGGCTCNSNNSESWGRNIIWIQS